MDVITRDVLQILDGMTHVRFSDRELFRHVCELRSKRNEDCTFVMVSRVLQGLIAARIVESVQFSGLNQLTDIGRMLLGKLDITPAAKDHLFRVGFSVLPFSYNTTKRDIEPSTNSNSDMSSRDLSKETDALNTRTSKKDRITTDYPPNADALHLSESERQILGLLFANKKNNKTPLDVTDFKLQASQVLGSAMHLELSEFLVQLMAKGFLTVVNKQVDITPVQLADLGWGESADSTMPLLHLYGLSAQAQLVLRDTVLRANGVARTSIATAAKCLRAAGMSGSDPKESKSIAKVQLQILEAMGFFSMVGGMYCLSKPALVLLGVGSPNEEILKEIAGNRKMSSLWTVFRGHYGIAEQFYAETLADAPETEQSAGVEAQSVDNETDIHSEHSNVTEKANSECEIKSFPADDARVVNAPFIDNYGFNSVEKAVLLGVVKHSQGKAVRTTLTLAVQSIRESNVLSDEFKYNEGVFARTAVDNLVKLGFLVSTPSGFYLQRTALMLLGVVGPDKATVNRVTSTASLNAHLDTYLKLTPKAASMISLPENSITEELAVFTERDYTEQPNVEMSDVSEGRTVSEVENVASNSVFEDALEQLQLMSKAPVMPVFENIPAKVSILNIIGRSFAYDQPETQKILDATASFLMSFQLGDSVMVRRIQWAQVGGEKFEDLPAAVDLLNVLAKAFSGDQQAISAALSAIANDLHGCALEQ